MEATIRKPSAGAMVLAVLLLLFGSLMFLFGYFALSEWQSERAALIACGVVWISTGRIGGIAVVASGTVLAAAAAVGVLQCSGPA
jgi:hypothetical protein